MKYLLIDILKIINEHVEEDRKGMESDSNRDKYWFGRLNSSEEIKRRVEYCIKDYKKNER